MEEDVFLPPQSFLVCVAAAAAPPLFSCFQQAIEEGEEGERKRRGVSFEVDKGKSCSTHRMRGGERERIARRGRTVVVGKEEEGKERGSRGERDSPTSIPLSLSVAHIYPPSEETGGRGKKDGGGGVAGRGCRRRGALPPSHQ